MNTTLHEVLPIEDVIRSNDLTILESDEHARTFMGIASAEVVDTYKTLFDLNDIVAEIPTMLSRGIALSIEHSDLIVGKILEMDILRMEDLVNKYPHMVDKLDYSEDMADIKTLVITSEVYSDYPDLDDVIWDMIQSGEFNGLSIRGIGNKTDEIRCDTYTKTCGNVIRNTKLTAVTLTKDGGQSNPLSTIITRMKDRNREVNNMEDEQQTTPEVQEESRMEVCPTCGQPMPSAEEESPPVAEERMDCGCGKGDEESVMVSRSKLEALITLAEKGKELEKKKKPAILAKMDAVLSGNVSRSQSPPNITSNSDVITTLKEEILRSLVTELGNKDIKRSETPVQPVGREQGVSQNESEEVKVPSYDEVFNFYRSKKGRPPLKHELNLHLIEGVPLPTGVF